MLSNYHSHSRWCRHGKGELEEYVQEALAHGLKEMALTEHVPHRYPAFSWIPWDSLPQYHEEVDRLVAKYKDQISIIKGFECEYFPDEMDDYRELKEKHGYQLMFLGHHYCGKNKEIDVFLPKGARELHIYADEVCEGLETGFFAFLAHPDCVLHKYENDWDGDCESIMRQIFATCEKLDIPVEINSNGLRGGRRYPSREAFLVSKDYKLRYLISSDAHSPEQLCDFSVGLAEQFAGELGIRVEPFLPKDLLKNKEIVQ